MDSTKVDCILGTETTTFMDLTFYLGGVKGTEKIKYYNIRFTCPMQKINQNGMMEGE